jgi:hypothetical protein
VYVKPKTYYPFGRFLIHKYRLGEGICCIRRPSGQALKELPTHKVSSGVANILKSIAGGSIPHYDHIAGLGAKEHDHLHRILKISHIDNVPVARPTKNNEEKDNDRFDILKGEIMAGNDNKTLVREFKVLLMRFIQSGRIPRREAHEILTDLTSMGF